MSLSPVERVLLERRLARRRYDASPLGGTGGLALAALLGAPLAAAALALTGAGVAYAALAGDLRQGIDRIQNLDARETFESTHIYDRNGTLLREVFVEGRRTYVSLAEIPEAVRQATIAVEDKTFYTNPGVEVTGILRAIDGELTGRPSLGGGSTVTQQFVRHVAFSDEERLSRSYARKAKEIVLALMLTRQHGKDQILEWYLNEIYYGNLAYGIEAASETVFGKPAKELDLAESSLLVGLPQLPATLDPLNPDPAVQERVRARQRVVLNLMAENGFITRSEADAAASEELSYSEREKDYFLAPHFVVYVEELAEEMLEPERYARGGLEIITTLDMSLQTLGESVVRENVEELRDRHNLSNAALVAMEPRTGQVLAMVGSADHWNKEIDGEVNMALWERQPGSSIKPITYVTALETGQPTSTFLWDVPMEIWTAGGRYTPKNYGDEFHGPVRLRAALANSYNLAALRLLIKMGTPLNPLEGVAKTIETAHRMGINGLNEDPGYYGISLTLGGGEVTLLDMVTAYSTLANGGELVRPNPVLRITDSAGRVLYDLAEDKAALTPEEAVDEGAAYIVTDILSDNAARTPAFGSPSKLEIGVPAAAKTGTTNDFKDNWTLGYTPYLTTGVWAGNNDNSKMIGSSGLTGAGPIWNAFMRGVVHDDERRAIVRQARESFGFDFRTDFEQPEGVVEAAVCHLKSLNQLASGCPELETELFLEEMLTGGVSDAGEGSASGFMGPDGKAVLPPGVAPDVWQLSPAVVAPPRPPPPELLQAWAERAAEEGEKFEPLAPVPAPAFLCLPGGPGMGDEKVQPVAVLPLPPLVEDRFALDGEARRFVVEWAMLGGWAALEPSLPCAPEEAAAALEPGSLITGYTGGLPGLAVAPSFGFTRAEYYLNLAPGAVLTSTTVLTGTVTYDPSRIEYYKVELGPGRQPTEWFTLGDIHQGPIVNGQLEVLDAASLPPGEYIVRLVLVKNDGNFLNPPHSVPLRIGR